MSITKITNASVRVSLSYNYNTFEVSLGLENPDGISPDEIEEFRLTAQDMANEAVEDFKAVRQSEIIVNSASEKKTLIDKMKSVTEDGGNKREFKDTAKVADILKQPLYTDAKKGKK